MATILFNCIFLAMTEPVEEAEYIFLAIYSIEMIIKIIAKGFLLNKYTYLRNPWNWLDFVVITSGYATIGMEVGNLAGLRTFRVLRALKTVSIMPGLKTIINALLHSFRQLAEVMTLTIFCLMVFALFALQVYMGELRNKCVKMLPEQWINATNEEWITWMNDTQNWLFDEEELPVLCGNLTGARHCPEGYFCFRVGENPNHGYTNFDNFMWSMLTTFQLITLDYWENVYNMILSTSGPMSVSFFTVVVFFGSFYLINLMLAVVALSYEEEAEITNEERKKNLLDHRDDSTFSFDPSVLNLKKLNKNNVEKIDSSKRVLLSSYNKKKVRRKKAPKDGEKDNKDAEDSESKSNKSSPASVKKKSTNQPANNNNNTLSHTGQQYLQTSRQTSFNSSGVNGESSQDDSGVVDDKEELDAAVDKTNLSIVKLQNEHVPVTLALSPREVRLIKCNGNISRINKKHNVYKLYEDLNTGIVVIDDLPDRNCDTCVQCCVDYETWLRFQNCLYNVVTDPLFELAITLCILLNTALLAVEHHGMTVSVRNALDIGNKIFTSVFTFECVIKLMALSKDFFLCGWNIFDLIIVIVSMLDIIFELVDGLSVLRGLRLLRVLKLAQSWTTMKVLLSIIISTIGALGNLTLILVIVIYIFAVIGMQLFSKDYTPEKFDPDPVPRWNFNDFFHSFMMIFRILCGEWIEPLWDCMRAEEEQGASSCFAIFLPALVMGNFMVLNLFLALLLNSFNSEELKSKKEEVGKESRLARSIERIRDMIRRKRAERNEQKYDTKFQEVVVRAQQAHKTALEMNKPSLISETKFDRLSYQESMNRPISGSDFGFQIPLKDSHAIEAATATETAAVTINGPPPQLLEEDLIDETKTDNSCRLDNNFNRNDLNTLTPQINRSLPHQVSSGFGTQPNNSHEERTESIEMRHLGRFNSADTDSYPKQQHSDSDVRGHTWQGPCTRRASNAEYDEAFLKYQRSLISRSLSYRKSLDRLSQTSNLSQRSLLSLKLSDENLQVNLLRQSSGHSLNTISLELEDLLSQQGNLLDELLNCEQKDLFRFLAEDADKNYFSETVGYSSGLGEPHSESLTIQNSLLEDKKSVLASPKSNVMYLTNSLRQELESRRSSHHSSEDKQENLPLIDRLEFDNIIRSFERELSDIKYSTTSLEKRLSVLSSKPSPTEGKTILENIAIISKDNKCLADEQNYEKFDLSAVPRRKHSFPTSLAQRNSIKLKRRSLEKQRNIDYDFSISKEIRKLYDELSLPCLNLEGASTKIPAQFDCYERKSLIERVEELPEDETAGPILRIESEKLPRKKITPDVSSDAISLKGTNSYEQLLIQKQINRNQVQATAFKTVHKLAGIPLAMSANTTPLPAATLRPMLKEYQKSSMESNKTSSERSKITKRDKLSAYQSQRTESQTSSGANVCSTVHLNGLSVRASCAGSSLCSQVQSSCLTQKPWQCLVSYVDDLTVGLRGNANGDYQDGVHFSSFKPNKPPQVPVDCFPQKCIENFLFRCPCFNYCIDSPTAKHWTRIRTSVLTIVDTPAFEWFVLVLIFASSVTLCFEDIYLDNNKPLKRVLYWTNLSFCLIFVIEMVLKWLALGFSKYFTSFWTILDFIIVFVSVFSLLIEENENIKVLRSLRTLRALRPLRAISRWQGMRIVVNALMYAIPSIFNVLLVCLVFWLIFSIMGVQFFGGKFFKCVDDEGEILLISEVNDRLECLEKNYTWINSKITFDHVGMGYLALLQVATFEGWMEIMTDAVDARGVDLQPQREANLYAYIYFVIFIVCGSFFTLNLFIGVIIDNFNMLKKKYEGGVLEMFLTESQKHYYTAMKKLGRKKPQKVIKRPINSVLAMFYDMSNSRRFEIAIFALIFLNMLTMGIEHYNQPYSVSFVLEVSNAFFTTVFGLEATVKIIGLRFHYFTVPWNMFDFVLVCASIFGILMEDIMIDLPISPTLLRVVRVFRIGRILRLIKAAKGIRKLLFALVVSLPALFNIGALLGLITFIYAILGMSLFGHVKLQGALDDMVNFQTFGHSMQLLFRLMTAAGWNDVLESLMIQPPDCDPHFNKQSNGNCGNPLMAITYFTSFIIISYMIVINMYIAIILENFNQAHQEEEIGIVEDDLEMFYIRWSKYDPHATQFIHLGQIADFIASLDPPLGIPKPNTIALVSFNLPISKGNKIHCLDILHALVKHVLGHVEETDNFKELQDQMNLKFRKQFPTRKELEIVSSTRIWKRQEKAAKTIQNAWKSYLKRKTEEGLDNESVTQASSPGGWQAKLSALNFFHLQVSRRGTMCSTRASSRKSSQASNVSDISELAKTSLNLPLMFVSGTDDVMKEIKTLSEQHSLKRGSTHIDVAKPSRRRSFHNFFLRHQDAVDDSVTPPVHRKSEIHAPEVMVTKPSPEQLRGSMNLRPDNSTLVHVLVHRESEEYKEENISSPETAAPENNITPQAVVSPPSPDRDSVTCDIFTARPFPEIMVNSPEEPPKGDFSTAKLINDEHNSNKPIDVNIQGDTSKVFYEYDPETAQDNIMIGILPQERSSTPVITTSDREVPESVERTKDIR